MAPKGKLIHCHGCEPLFVSKEYRQPWADVWLSWTSKPGRTKMKYAPCLVSKPSAEQDLMITEDCARLHPDLNYKDDLARERRVLSALTALDSIHIEEFANKHMPEIATSREYIDRREAERMLRYYFETMHRMPLVRFKWHRPHHVVIPM